MISENKFNWYQEAHGNPQVLAYARSIACAMLGLGLNDSGFKRFLTASERKAVIDRKFILPAPYLEENLPSKYCDTDDFLITMARIAESGKPMYLIKGVFDIYHLGHWLLIEEASKLAKATNGKLGIMVEGDEFSPVWKNKESLFPVKKRMGWFEGDKRVDMITDYGSPGYPDLPGAASWEYGTGKLLAEFIPDPRARKNVKLVVPDFNDPRVPLKEAKAILRSEHQFKKHGFEVVRLKNVQAPDVSSSILRKRWGLDKFTKVSRLG